MTTLTLPFPPSINHYWRHFRGRTVISQEGRAFRQNVCALLASSGRPMMEGRLALRMDVNPPDRRRRDLDNLQKSVLDALQHAGVYQDDSQIDLLVTTRGKKHPPGHVTIEIQSHPPQVCPVCGGPHPINPTSKS